MTAALDPRMPRPPEGWPPRSWRRRLARAADRASARLSGRHPIGLEYPPAAPDPQRWGWGRPPNAPLRELLLAGRERYGELLELIAGHAADLRAIGRGHAAGARWDQTWWPGLDAAALYCFIRTRAPARYHEIGSGNSTLFAAAAIADGGLHTRILSIDPAPRAEVDAVCDELRREPLQSVDPAVISALEAGDVLVIDSSHYALQGSDVTAFFLDVLPALAPGVLVAIHDVFLPDDYPWWLADRWYSEQYLLAAWLLGAASADRVVLPAHFMATEPQLRRDLDATWRAAGLEGLALAYGSSFWLRT